MKQRQEEIVTLVADFSVMISSTAKSKYFEGKDHFVMRMLLTVTIPHEPFNTLVRAKKIGPLIQKILADIKPEMAVFTEEDGTRGAVLLVDVTEPSKVPALAEPWFLNFNADCRFRIAMSPEELGRAGLDAIAAKWG